MYFITIASLMNSELKDDVLLNFLCTLFQCINNFAAVHTLYIIFKIRSNGKKIKRDAREKNSDVTFLFYKTETA